MNPQKNHSNKDVVTIIATAVANESGNIHSKVLNEDATRKRLQALITAEDVSLTEREDAMLRVMNRVAVYSQTAAVASLLEEIVELNESLDSLALHRIVTRHTEQSESKLLALREDDNLGPGTEWLLASPIEKLELSTRARGVLEWGLYGLSDEPLMTYSYTIGDVVKLSLDDLKSMRGAGKIIVAEIVQALAKHGLQLADSDLVED